MIVALYLGNMKMFLLLSLISIMCSCVHKNTDEEVWKDLLGKTTSLIRIRINIRIRFSWIAWERQYIRIIMRDLMLIPPVNWL